MRCRKWEVQVLRWHEGALDKDAESLLLKHLERCVHCRTLADQFAKIDKVFEKTRGPSLPPFLKERIISSVSQAMRQGPMKGLFSRFFSPLASFRPSVAGAVLVLGIGLGVVVGWNLAVSVSRIAPASSYDLLSVAEFGRAGSGASLEFIWTDGNGSTGR